MRCSTSKKQVTIVQGSDINLTVQLLDKDSGLPFSLAGFTGATAFFENADNTELAVTGTLQSADLGKMNFPLTAAETTGLQVGDEENIEVEVDQSGVKTVVQFPGGLVVSARLF